MPAGDDDDDDDAMDLCYATHSAIQSGLILSYQESNREREHLDDDYLWLMEPPSISSTILHTREIKQHNIYPYSSLHTY